ncbi:UNVERIFIED_CONTAM: hypothetical protein NCL1_41089 [Trichonephila clavipes]
MLTARTPNFHLLPLCEDFDPCQARKRMICAFHNVQDMLEGIVEVQGILSNNNTLQCEKIINFPSQMTEKFDLALFNETMILVEHLPNHYAVLA